MEGDSEDGFYRECLRNHAASLGNYATDGCGEFTLDGTAPGGLQCAACGCHRNFHRKIVSIDDGGGRIVSKCSRGREPEALELIEYGARHTNTVDSQDSERSGKKRNRTKFTAEQKEKMLAFADKLGWKLQRKDEENEIERFCRGVGVSRQVFKVWMHNHKNSSSSSSASTANASSLTQ